MCRLMFVVMCLGRVLVAGASIQPLVPDDNLEPSLASSSRVVVVLSPLTSGLNNQLMKVGYLLQTFCREPESRLVLPRFSTNLSHSQSRAWLAFGEVFDEEYFIQEFASKCTLLPSDYTPSSDQEKVQVPYQIVVLVMSVSSLTSIKCHRLSTLDYWKYWQVHGPRRMDCGCVQSP
jgi:hypothetical protein